MSGGDLIEYFGSDERKQPSDMLNRTHNGLFNAIQQQRIEQEVDGIREGSGVGGRVERRGESQRIMREIAGGPINPALLRGLQEGMINAGRYFGINLSPKTTLLDGLGRIGEVVNTGLGAVESAYDLVNRGREQIGAGVLSDVESVFERSSVERSSFGMPSSDIFEVLQKKIDDLVARTKNPSLTSSEYVFWNRIINPNEYLGVDESIKPIPRIFETPDEKHANGSDDSESNLWAALENAASFRGLDRPPGGRRIPSWVDNLDFNGDGRIDRVELAVSKNGNATDKMSDIRLIHPLLAKAHRHPNFLRTKIEQKKIQKETPYDKTTQVNLVQQGEANFMKDFNQFNVNF